jgi:Fe-S-cluster containining protein
MMLKLPSEVDSQTIQSTAKSIMLPIKSDTGILKINGVEEEIFSARCVPDCFKFDVCRDICCSYGCDVSREEAARILEHKDVLQQLLKVPATRWFKQRWTKDADFPSGEFVRSRVHRGKCVFYAHELRGCMLHRFAVKQGFDPHLIKPMVCFMFPATWENGNLVVAGFLSELPCDDQGITVFESQKREIGYYFGGEIVKELDKLAAEQKKRNRNREG